MGWARRRRAPRPTPPRRRARSALSARTLSTFRRTRARASAGRPRPRPGPQRPSRSPAPRRGGRREARRPVPLRCPRRGTARRATARRRRARRPESSIPAPRPRYDADRPVLHRERVEPDRFDRRPGGGGKDQFSVRPARQRQDRLFEPDVGEAEGPARELHQSELQPGAREGQPGRVGFRPRRRSRADLEIGRGKEPQRHGPVQRDAAARQRLETRGDFRAMGRPVDQIGRDQRRRQKRDDRDRDEGQNDAHGSTNMFRLREPTGERREHRAANWRESLTRATQPSNVGSRGTRHANVINLQYHSPGMRRSPPDGSKSSNGRDRNADEISSFARMRRTLAPCVRPSRERRGARRSRRRREEGGPAHRHRPAARLVQLRPADRQLQGEVRDRGQRAEPGRRLGRRGRGDQGQQDQQGPAGPRRDRRRPVVRPGRQGGRPSPALQGLDLGHDPQLGQGSRRTTGPATTTASCRSP